MKARNRVAQRAEMLSVLRSAVARLEAGRAPIALRRTTAGDDSPTPIYDTLVVDMYAPTGRMAGAGPGKDAGMANEKNTADRPPVSDGKTAAASTAEVPPVTSEYTSETDIERDSVDEDKSNLG